MSLRVTVSLDTAEYTGFDNTIPVSLELTERQAAICLSLMVLAAGRGVWNDMTDVMWDQTDADVAAILEQLMIP